MWNLHVGQLKLQTQTQNMSYLSPHNSLIPSDLAKYLTATLTKPTNCTATYQSLRPVQPHSVSTEGRELTDIIWCQRGFGQFT